MDNKVNISKGFNFGVGSESTDNFVLSEHITAFFNDPEITKKAGENEIEQLKQQYAPMFEKIEELYNNALNEKDVPKKLSAHNGIANFGDRKLLTHSAPLIGEEDLQSKKTYGILASEWFGKSESGGEARFCASFHKEHGATINETDEQTAKRRHNSENKAIYENGGYTTKKIKQRDNPTIDYIFDPNTTAVRRLLKLDFFKYARIMGSKKYKSHTNNFENFGKDREQLLKLSETDLDAAYSAEDSKFLSQLLEWSTEGESLPKQLLGITGHVEAKILDETTWSAIPGGMPSKNVIALRISEYSMENPKARDLIEKATEIWKVPVIDQTGKVLFGEKFLEQSTKESVSDVVK